MAKSVNRVTLLGNVGNDPEVRLLPSRTKAVSLRLATTERVKDGDAWKDVVEWHNLIAYGHNADVIEQFVKKGSRIYIEGKLMYRSWGDGPQKQNKTEIKIDELILADGPKREQQRDNADWSDFK